MLAAPATAGEHLASRLLDGIRLARNAPSPGARDLPTITSVGRSGEFLDPVENVLLEIADILQASRRVFRYGESVVLEIDRHDGAGLRLIDLRSGSRVETGAEEWMANLFVCQFAEFQFAPPRALVDVLLRSEVVLAQLPGIRVYARQPVFDDDFVLQGPGWHAEVGYLVHGLDVEPIPWRMPDSEARVLDRLPEHIRTLLAGFCFSEDADLVNAVGVLITGVLANHFVQRSKAIALVDGNQPGVGKTLLARAFGMVLSGNDPRLIHYIPDEEELQKRICATLREGRQGVLVVDNAKVRGNGAIHSPTIEANSMAPEITLRILGRSENFTLPNRVVWILTMNNTRTSPDLVSRGVAIRLSHDGDPRHRTFPGGDPVEYARRHRREILGELQGMILNWNQAGRQPGNSHHRCGYWAQVVGGVLSTAGFPEFLGNAGDAAAAFDDGLDQLAALAEQAAATPGFFEEADETRDDSGRPASEWEPIFRRAHVLAEELDASASKKSRATRIGRFLGPLLDRQVPVQVRDRQGTATLRVREGRARERRYFFVFAWESGEPGTNCPPCSGGATAEPRRWAVSSPSNGASPQERVGPPATENRPRPNPTLGGNAEVW